MQISHGSWCKTILVNEHTFPVSGGPEKGRWWLQN